MFAKFYAIPSLPFQDIEKPKRRGPTDNAKTVYTPQTQFAGGIKIDWKKAKIPVCLVLSQVPFKTGVWN